MKKVGMLVLALLACSMMMVACSSDKETTAADTTAAETTAAETTAADYMTWNKADWNKASTEEKTAAANVVLMNIGDMMEANFSQKLESAKTDAGVKAQIDAQVEALVGQIDTFFASATDDMTLQTLVDVSEQLVDSSSTTAVAIESTTTSGSDIPTKAESQDPREESGTGTVGDFVERYNNYVELLHSNDMGESINNVSVENLESDGTISLGNNCELAFNPNGTITKDSVVEIANFQCMDKGKADMNILMDQIFCFLYMVDPELSQEELESILSGEIPSEPLRGVVYKNYSMSEVMVIQAKVNAD